jgi:transcription elongation factor SPT4
MPRKGTATVKKKSGKYIYEDCSDEERKRERTPMSFNDDAETAHVRSSLSGGSISYGTSDSENVDPAVAREQLKLPNEAQREQNNGADQPRQDSIVEQSVALANALFPDNDISPANEDTPKALTTPNAHRQNRIASEARSPTKTSSTPRSRARTRGGNGNLASRAANPHLSSPVQSSPRRQQQRQSRQHQDEDLEDRDPNNMAQQGAYIPPGQQRNMRACMICSIVRTQQQFTTQGCPNCEDILELAGNPEQVNDCTSQVFEGLISVADTSRSWVARFQRLEGYVPGVYATQVEGILPEDILVAVENAGINYVPRDGSEQEMLGKD